MPSTATNPKVSVLMLAYNHGRYIRQAVESALTQRTTFPVEIVIGEDCSTDDTRTILQELASAHRDQVRVLKRRENIGPANNLYDTFKQCRGEFIAVLEGDDHWCDNDKLQRQVDFLTEHPDCALCFHDTVIVDDAGNPRGNICTPPPPLFSSCEHLLEHNYVPTCSVLYRRDALPYGLPRYTRALPMQDWPTWIHISLVGQLGYIDSPMACYRKHGQGLWSARSAFKRLCGEIAFYRAIRRHLPAHLSAIAARKSADLSYRAAWFCIQQGWRRRALLHLWNSRRGAEPTTAILWLMFETALGARSATFAKRVYRTIRGLRHSES